MTARVWLIVLFLFAHLVIAIWDIWAVTAGRPEDTVSSALLDWARQAPVIVLVIGFILGHLFWPQFVPLPKAAR